MTDGDIVVPHDIGNPAEKVYRFLIVEDSPADAGINEREVEKVLSPCRFLRCQTPEALTQALDEFNPDAIISDYTMPDFDGLSVLRITREISPFTPVIIVTGSIDEETAVKCLKGGAADYILKDHLKRLGPALIAALKRKDSRKLYYETQAALIESEEKYRALFENDPAGDFVTNGDGVITACNRAFAAALGFKTPREAKNQNIFQFCRHAKSCEDFLQILGGGKILENFGMELVRRDGRSVFARVNAYALFTPGHTIKQIVGFLIDETDQRQLEERLAQAQKLESLGTLAGGVAHDFNNILNIIMGYLSLLEKEIDKNEHTAHLAGTIQGAAERGAALVNQLLTFARKNETCFMPVRLSDVIGDVVKLASETFPRKIEIRVASGGDAPLVTADADQLHQVFLNLFVNARDALPEGGIITVEGGRVERRVLAARYPGTEGETYSFIRVTDTGTGMDEVVKARLFEPFFTTKNRDAGTGLGLSQVYGIIKQHRGHIDVDSEPGKGSAFTVYLPTRTSGEDIPGTREPETAATGGSETILLVEDEETLRDYLATVLKSKGYQVFSAADGQTALDLFGTHRVKINLILADFGLPKLDGPDLIKRIKSLEKNAVIVIMSGFADPDLKSFMAEMDVADFIQKPFSSESLFRIVRSTLDRRINRKESLT